jgi:hypothetical protein
VIHWLLQSKHYPYAKELLLIFAIFVSSCTISGCVESGFFLDSESRLPKCITLPPGLTREDVFVIFELHTNGDADFLLTNKKWKKLALVKVKLKGYKYPSRYYHIVSENNIKETITLEPKNEHGYMELFFYVMDDPIVEKKS